MHRMNGAGHPSPFAAFDLTDRGLTLGDGLFETIAVFGGKPALLDAHLDRMLSAAAEIRLPLDRATLEAEVLALAEAAEGDVVVRLTVTRGGGARGLAIPEAATPAIIASSSPYPKAAIGSPIRLATVSIRRNPTSFASRAKTLAYLDSVLAYDQAHAAGADDALMLNVDGFVASTSMANLFALIGEELVTPPISDGVLPGIIRAAVLQAAPNLGLTPVERSVAPGELEAATVFATNSVRLVMPVSEIDGGPVRGSEVVGAIAKAVDKACGR